MNTTLFNLPKGSSPLDNENVKLVKRVMKTATGAESIDVSFNHSADGEPLTNLYNIELEYPRMLAEGKYVSLADLDKNQGKLLADVITSLSSGGDAKGAVQKLLDSVGGSGDGDSDDSKPDELDLPKEDPSDGAGEAPTDTKPFSSPSADRKLPFAKKKSRIARASDLEKQFGQDLRDAIEIVKVVDSSPDFPSFQKKARQLILDENDKPLSQREYAEIAKVARGEEDFLG
jgi:hypothetical protein